MIFSLLTVAFYTASSLGDKFISAKIGCNEREFSFLVSASTALFLAIFLPFLGWKFSFTLQSCAALCLLVVCKIAEFYTSAMLLKSVSAYELKSWLSLNVAVSFLTDVFRGTERFFIAFVPCAVALAVGIGMTAFGGERKGLLRYVFLSILYVASKFTYGFGMNLLRRSTSPVPALILVMLGVAFLQLPFLRFREFFKKRGIVKGALTRIPNAAGLWTEAIAAQQNLLLYSLVQPMQLAILLVVAIARRERPKAVKLAGGLLTLAAVTAMTVLIYLNGGDSL